MATESVLPSSWGYDAKDSIHLKAIHRKFGRHRLKNFPTRGFLKTFILDPYFAKRESINVLNYINYEKDLAKKQIQDELNWRDYGGKHFESIFTRFFQGYYLPRRFGFDKRKAHLSSMILSGQLTREKALDLMKTSDYSDELKQQDKEFVAKKLEFSPEQFEDLLNTPGTPHENFSMAAPIIENLRKLKKAIKP